MSDVEACNLARDGRVTELVNTINSSPDIVNKTDSSGRTVMHWSACGGHVELIKRLIEGGCKPDVPDASGWTPLMIAVSAGREDVVAYLLDSGLAIDINVVNSTGQNCLHYAASRNRLSIARRLLLAGIKADVRDWGGNTPLHRGASRGHVEMVKLLLAGDALDDGTAKRAISKCSPNTPNDTGQTPLHNACEEGSVDIVRILLNAGGDLTTKDKEGKTPADLAPDSLRIAMHKELKLQHQ